MTPGRGWAPRAWAWVQTSRGASVVVGCLVAAGFVSRFLLARYVQAPWEMPDELEYALTSRSFLSTGHYLFREHAQPLRTIYPALISPAWLAGSTHTAYTLIKLINAALMALGAIPLYLWSRRLAPPLWGALAVALYFAMPDFMYTGEILTENAFVPASLLAMFAIAMALERPTLLRQLLALGAIVLAAATRLQGLIFLIVLPTAILLVVLFDAVATAPGERRRAAGARLRAFWPSLAIVAGLAVLYALLETVRGSSISSGLGTYHQLSSAHYSVRLVLRWIAFHFGELSFAVGLLPVAALVILFGLACRRATAPAPAERAFVAVASASVLWILVQVGAFASRFSFRIEERYMYALAPVLFLALVVWLARGLPRTPGLTAAAVLVPVAFLLTLPFESFFTQALFNDTFGLIPLWRLTNGIAGGTAEARALVGLGALVAGILFAGLPRAWGRVVVPAVVAAFLLVSSASVFAEVTFLSSATRHAGGVGADPSWIDHAVGKNARVEILDTADLADPHIAWQAAFWNRSVRRLFGVNAQDPSIPDVAAAIGRGGRIVPGLAAGSPDLEPRYVLSASNLDVDGTRIASAGQLALWRVRRPLRLGSLAVGITPDSWTGAQASYTVYSLPPGARELVVHMSRIGLPGLPDAHVVVTTANTTHKLTVPGGGSAVLRLPVRRAPFTVAFVVSPTFSPSQFGSPDSRVLGVRVSFAVR